MIRSRTRRATRGRHRLLPLVVLAGCGPLLPTAVEDAETAPGIALSLDTLDIDAHLLWVRVSGVPPAIGELRLDWELRAETANPHWRPRIRTHAGTAHAASPDTAKVWGNIPRAYDFILIVSGMASTGELAADTLRVMAPACGDPGRPNLLCNPRPRVGADAHRTGRS